MTTKLEKPLKREIQIDGKPYVITLTPDGVKLTVKGRRNGPEMAWKEMAKGDPALAAGLNASADEVNS